MADLREEKLFNPNELPKEPNYWRSFEDLHNDPALIEASHHEFKEGVKEDFNPGQLSGISRRKFLALIGASAALAGTGCSDYLDKGEIIPYTNKPEEVTLGKANYYASVSYADGSGEGVLIKTREGRPIKVDGNPDHPVGKGKISARSHAHIMNLYDPERLQYPTVKGKAGNFVKSTWQQSISEILKDIKSASSKEIAIITHRVSSPTALKLLNEFKSVYPTANIYSYELFDNSYRTAAWKKCYGTDFTPSLRWDKAKIILSLEGDFLGVGDNTVENSRLFAAGRDVMNVKDFSRLYVIEGNLSLTGMNADYRMRLRPDAQHEFVLSLIGEVLSKGSDNLGVDSQFFRKYSLDAFASKYSLDKKILGYLVSDLLKNRSTSLVYAGDTLPESVHVAVNLLNEILGSQELYDRQNYRIPLHSLTTASGWETLISNMNAGNVAAVIHFGTNPVYHFSPEFGYAEALGRVSTVVSLSTRQNETTAVSGYVLPDNHDFESWGDHRSRSGFYALQQPVIAPLFNTRQKEAVLLQLISGAADNYDERGYHKYLMNNWESSVYPSVNSKFGFKDFWYAGLHDGVVRDFTSPSLNLSFNKGVLAEINTVKEPGGFALVLQENNRIGDGRHADNGWLQELPHPVSKVTWDNYAAVSETTAKSLGVKTNEFIEITSGNRSLKVPVLVHPGTADNVIAIELGYGRSISGTVGTGVGFNANVLLAKKGGFSRWIYSNVSVTKSAGSYQIVSTQDHHKFDDALIQDIHYKRNIIQEGTVAQYISNPKFIKEKHHIDLVSVNKNFEYTGVKWAMSIDLNKCTGCAECVVACNSENNIPVVGKEQVATGREMSWLRIDRYFSGKPDNPKVSLQPMLCQHCDQAPCENVCPVVATTHSPDGLNQMVYNRCVGTRYCSNNCPYKVRRFNFFNFRDHFNSGYQENSIFALLHNPEVTVRSRGVMEKCTFCIQRIMDARSEAVRENRELKGDDVRTACQEACSTEAIKFGDMNDPASELNKYRKHELGYVVLEELNVNPNVTYIAKLRNIHSEEAL